MTQFDRVILFALAAPLLVGAGCLKETQVSPVGDQDVKITFIHTADWHSRLLPYNLQVSITDQALGLMTKSSGPTSVGGAARAATVIKRIRSAGGRIVHIDSGDVFQGAPIFNEFDGEVEFKIYTQLGVDAMAIGNHEFDMGVANLVQKAKQFARFPLLAANYDIENPNVPGASELASIAHPYVILNKEGVKIGVIGLGCLSSIVSLYYGGNSLGATPLETVRRTQFWVDFLRPQVDVIVVVSHLGLRGEKRMTRGDELDLEVDCPDGNCPEYHTCPIIERLVGDEQVIRYTNGIDVVFGGHLHIVLDPPEVIQDCNPDPSCLDSEHGKEILDHLAELGCYCYPEGNPKYDPDCKPIHRRVPLVHSGAFLKYVGQLDTVFHKPAKPEPPQGVDCNANPDNGQCKQYHRELVQWVTNGLELASHRYILHPVDERITPDQFDGDMQRLLQPYTLYMNRKLQLGRVIAFAPRKIRRFATGHGDSALGDIVATSMQTRNRVEAHFAITNTLGIRADFEPGPITVDIMYNVFPFENTITTMTLSGAEVYDLMDYIALRSARRGCSPQAQVSGVTALLNCNESSSDPYGERAFRVTIGGSRLSDPSQYGVDQEGNALCQADGFDACTPASDPVCVDLARCAGDVEGACPSPAPQQPDPPCCNWRNQPIQPCPDGHSPGDGFCCPPGELCTPVGCGMPVARYASYKLAANDYIAHGGSGFTTLEHNTTQFDTGVSLRDAVIDYVFTHYEACGKDETNMKLCVESMTQFFRNDCAYLSGADRDDCEAQAAGRAEDLCDELPCVTQREDGRIERIFPTK